MKDVILPSTVRVAANACAEVWLPVATSPLSLEPLVYLIWMLHIEIVTKHVQMCFSESSFCMLPRSRWGTTRTPGS